MNREQTTTIIHEHRGLQGSLISILEDIQDKYHYLPEEIIRDVARETGLSLVDIYSVATFYKTFSLKPKGKHLISVCMGTACHVRGSQGVLEEFARQLNLTPGKTSADREFTLETVNCLGTCALGPIVAAEGRYFSNVKRKDVKKIINAARKGFEAKNPTDGDAPFPLKAGCPWCGKELMDSGHPIDDNPSIFLMAPGDSGLGRIHLSSLYGSSSYEASPGLSVNSPLILICPHCGKDLGTSDSECIECGSAMIHLSILGGGRLYLCTNMACRSDTISLDDRRPCTGADGILPGRA